MEEEKKTEYELHMWAQYTWVTMFLSLSLTSSFLFIYFQTKRLDDDDCVTSVYDADDVCWSLELSSTYYTYHVQTLHKSFFVVDVGVIVIVDDIILFVFLFMFEHHSKQRNRV